MISEYVKGQIETYCYAVSRGRPTAMIPIKTRYINEAENIIRGLFKLKVFSKNLAEGWTILWIYKKDFMLEVIKCLPEKPKTVYDHWVLGKAFGYSDEAIEEYVRS